MSRIALLGDRRNRTTAELLVAWRSAGAEVEAMRPARALRVLAAGDVAVARLDVAPTVDGVEPGLAALVALAARGVRVVNGARPLVAVHDKLRTARILAAVGIPHPASALVRPRHEPALVPPLVLKPRFGSWGEGVRWCASRSDLAQVLEEVVQAPWFRRHGALVQEAVEPLGYDLRVILAGGRVVGGGKRVAAPGEWRTNVSLGGRLEPALVPPEAGELALTAAAVVGADLVGVDLLPLRGGGWTVLELNGAVDFDDLAAADATLYERIGRAVGVLPAPRRAARRTDEREMRVEPHRPRARGTIGS